jgi:hypothetical protein
VLRAIDINGNAGDAAPINVASAEDLDADGLPDAWERKYFGGEQAAATDDPDGDGLSNLQEYQMGTDPVGGASAPVITALERTPAGLRISFTATAGRSYQLERTDDLLGGQWGTIGTPQTAAGTMGYVIDHDGYTSRQHFYRIRVLP